MQEAIAEEQLSFHGTAAYTARDGGYAEIASLHGSNLLGQCREQLPGSKFLSVHPVHAPLFAIHGTAAYTARDGGYAEIAGANFCPYILYI